MVTVTLFDELSEAIEDAVNYHIDKPYCTTRQQFWSMDILNACKSYSEKMESIYIFDTSFETEIGALCYEHMYTILYMCFFINF